MRSRVIRHPLDRWIAPELVFRSVYAERERAFWLDAGADAQDGRSYLGEGGRLVTASAAHGTVTTHPVDAATVTEPGDIFEYLGAHSGAGAFGASRECRDAQDEGFRLGWVGWFGYELHATTVPMPRTAQPRRSRYPDAAWMDVTRALEFDHAARSVTLLALGERWSGELAEWRDSVIAALSVAERADPSAAHPADRGSPAVRWSRDDDEYLEMIRQCQIAIARGDAYQLCLTTEAEVDSDADPAQCYLALRAMSPSQHGGYLRVDDVALLSTSPEEFLTVSADRRIQSRPIKGTRRRGRTAQEDDELRRELQASDKERAENVMIVDLMRNDIASVSTAGSVEVPDLLAVESYAQVHQLVSTVRGTLAATRRPMDAVVACFPGGSMTGAPKSSAVSILDGLENRARGIYSGAFGYVGLDGRIELAMVIRSIVFDRHGATVAAGGGITALSVPREELEEVKVKAAAMLAALGVVAETSVGEDAVIL